MVTDFAIFWIDSPWECGGRWVEEKVTKCDQIWRVQKIRLCKVFKKSTTYKVLLCLPETKTPALVMNWEEGKMERFDGKE